MDDIFGQLLLQLSLIALNAIFACAEIALISINGTRVEKLAEEGDKRAFRLARLTSQPARFLATIQVAITLSGFMGSAFAAENFAESMAAWLDSLGTGLSAATLESISVVLITLILSYVTLVFGELVPKRLAMRNAEKLALSLANLVNFISKIFAPIVWLLTISTNALLRIFGVDPNADDNAVTEEEIRMMVDSGSEKGIIDEEESVMIQNVFEFDDLEVGEIVTHRTEVSFLWNDETMDQWDKTIRETSYSFYPICEDSIDNIIGILNAKIYLRMENATRNDVMANAVREVFYVPESMKADILFRNMKKDKNNFAVVLDEYGGTHGIVTMSDLLVQIVGEFDDEEVEEEIIVMTEGEYKINCRAEIEKLEKLFDIDAIETESSTVGGWVVETLGDIPDEGESFVYKQLRVTVTSVDEKRVLEISVCEEKPMLAAETE